MKAQNVVLLAATMLLAGCDTARIEVPTHSSREVNQSEKAAVLHRLASDPSAPGIMIEHIEGSEHRQTGVLTVCGYVTGITPAGTRSRPALFGGQIEPVPPYKFTPFAAPGKGQNNQRTATLRSLCAADGLQVR
ncbi:hypothetical protein FPY71_09435 [Aureimonas fodinaquatilis]|uniref:Uncharacterized protein n=1 Tax=Aureimonas fodinaquatilis TaxID=2565783 RepID=A0A5B0DYR4_9HYPH|nr:hypothetical protein [Aureimonas fodinaquatilis]KAA0970700.1 hypothetical protein FPY71_09435 [Aureimonas fodinaquatilis]